MKHCIEDSAAHLHYLLTAALVRKFGMGEVAASVLAMEVSHGLRDVGGGNEIYIPAPDKRARDEAIRAEFNGRNGVEIMAKYGISKASLYRVLK